MNASSLPHEKLMRAIELLETGSRPRLSEIHRSQQAVIWGASAGS